MIVIASYRGKLGPRAASVIAARETGLLEAQLKSG
jgi:hypothetical protein